MKHLLIILLLALTGATMFSSCSHRENHPTIFRAQDVQSHIICAAYLYGPNVYKMGDTVWINIMANNVIQSFPYKKDYSGYLRRCVILDTLNTGKLYNFASRE